MKLVPEGIEGRVPYKGSLSVIIHSSSAACARAWAICGCKTLERAAAAKRASCRSPPPALRESHVHDVFITKEAPNYPASKGPEQ